MSPEALNSLFSLCIGFALAGALTSGYQLWAERPAGWNVWNEQSDKTFAIKGHRSGAKLLASGLLGADFDVAYAYQPLHTPLGHASPSRANPPRVSAGAGGFILGETL